MGALGYRPADRNRLLPLSNTCTVEVRWLSVPLTSVKTESRRSENLPLNTHT